MIRTKKILAFVVAPAFALVGAFWMAQTRDLSLIAAYVAVIGAIMAGALGTYTTLDADRKLTERPAALREALLGTGPGPVAPASWRAFQALRLAGLLLLLGAFALSLIISISAWRDGAVHERRLHRLEQDVYLLYQLPGVPERVKQAYNEGFAADTSR